MPTVGLAIINSWKRLRRLANVVAMATCMASSASSWKLAGWFAKISDGGFFLANAAALSAAAAAWVARSAARRAVSARFFAKNAAWYSF